MASRWQVGLVDFRVLWRQKWKELTATVGAINSKLRQQAVSEGRGGRRAQQERAMAHDAGGSVS